MPEPVKKKSLVEQTFEKFPQNAPSKKEFENFKEDFTNTIKELTLDDVLDAATLTDKAYAPEQVSQPYSDKSLQSIPMQLPPEKPSNAPQIPERQPNNLPTNDDLRNRLLPPKEEPVQAVPDTLPPEDPVESSGESYRATPETPEPGNQYPPEFKMGGKKPQSPDDGQPDVWNRELGLEDYEFKYLDADGNIDWSKTTVTGEDQVDDLFADDGGYQIYDDPNDDIPTLAEAVEQEIYNKKGKRYAQLDLSPMMALTDAWTGSQLTKEYRRPPTYDMLRERELKREFEKDKLRRQLAQKQAQFQETQIYKKERDLQNLQIEKGRLEDRKLQTQILGQNANTAEQRLYYQKMMEENELRLKEIELSIQSLRAMTEVDKNDAQTQYYQSGAKLRDAQTQDVKSGIGKPKSTRAPRESEIPWAEKSPDMKENVRRSIRKDYGDATFDALALAMLGNRAKSKRQIERNKVEINSRKDRLISDAIKYAEDKLAQNPKADFYKEVQSYIDGMIEEIKKANQPSE